MKKILIMLLLYLPVCTFANVYEQSDLRGNITYTDQPSSKNATQVKELNGNIVQSIINDKETAKETSTAPDNNQLAEEKKIKYTRFSIASPADQETLQNQPTLTVTLAIEPELQKGDTVQVYLDGQAWGNALPSAQLTFTIPYRGTHHIYAKLLNKNGTTVMTTSTHEIYVHQAHLGQQQTVYNFPDRK